MPNANAWAAPQRPMRTPSRFSPPAPTSAIIEPIAATAYAPLVTPSMKTVSRNGHDGPTKAAAARHSNAIAEARQPPMVHICRFPRERG